MGLYFLSACALLSAAITFFAVHATDGRKALEPVIKPAERG
jgi:hypothetical protein